MILLLTANATSGGWRKSQRPRSLYIVRNPKGIGSEKALQQNDFAELYTRIPISNGFCIQSDLISSKADGCFEIDFFQGHGHTADYRLACNAGNWPSFELQRFGRSGARCLANLDQTIKLEDGYHFLILFSRDESSGMSVSLDGRTLVQTNDKSFRNPFNEIALINDGGDLAVREISVMGAQ